MDFDIKNLIYQLVPPHKRLPVRLKWLSALLSPLMDLWVAFYAWRQTSRMLINVNSQTQVFEGYLRAKYNEPIAIKIESYSDGLPWFPLSTESEYRQEEFHSSPDGEPVPEIPLSQEVRGKFDDADFIIYIPARLNRTLIEAEIDKYKQALIKYKIIQK